MQTLQAGDVITIPKGVPHWFKAVDGKVKYFVVKVRD
jgi:quercetin dioxygenase-like cupin family protein